MTLTSVSERNRERKQREINRSETEREQREGSKGSYYTVKVILKVAEYEDVER